MKIFAVTFFLLMFFAISNAQWQKQNIETKASLRGLSVVSEKIIWASGTGGTVLRTVDGGKNWAVIKVPEAEKLDFRDIEAFDTETAYILSIGTGENSRIYKTTDGGKNWKLQFQNTNKKAFFDALAFWDKQNGTAMSDPVDGKYVLIETHDGETWKPIVTPPLLGTTPSGPVNCIPIPGRGNLCNAPYAKDGEAAFAASGTCLLRQGKNNVFLVSGGNDARVFRSEDRGQKWAVAETPIVKGTAGSGIFSIAMFDAKNGVIVGGNYEKPNDITNNLAFTADGGKTWTLSKGLNGYRSGVAYIDKKTLLAVGASGSDLSTDGGKTWKNLDKENYNSVQAKGKKVIWAVGANGLVSKLTITK